MDNKLREALDSFIEGLEVKEYGTAIMSGAVWMSQRTYSEDEVKDLVLKTVSTFSALFSEEEKKKLAEEFFEINKKFIAQ